MEIPLQDERLNTGANEEQSCVEEALPGRGAGVVDKGDQQTGWDQEKEVISQI